MCKLSKSALDGRRRASVWNLSYRSLGLCPYPWWSLWCLCSESGWRSGLSPSSGFLGDPISGPSSNHHHHLDLDSTNWFGNRGPVPSRSLFQWTCRVECEVRGPWILWSLCSEIPCWSLLPLPPLELLFLAAPFPKSSELTPPERPVGLGKGALLHLGRGAGWLSNSLASSGPILIGKMG